MALEALEYAEQHHGADDCYADSIKALKGAVSTLDKLVFAANLYKWIESNAEYIDLTSDPDNLVVIRHTEGVTAGKTLGDAVEKAVRQHRDAWADAADWW